MGVETLSAALSDSRGCARRGHRTVLVATRIDPADPTWSNVGTACLAAFGY